MREPTLAVVAVAVRIIKPITLEETEAQA